MGALPQLRQAPYALFGSHDDRVREALSPPYANILKSHRPEAHGIEQVFRVDDDGFLEQVFDAIEIESAKLGPARAHNQRVHAFGGRVGRLAVSHRAV